MNPQIWDRRSAKREILYLIEKPRVHRGCTEGVTRSYAGRSSVRATSVAMKSLKSKKVKVKGKREKRRGSLKVKGNFEKSEKEVYI